ncbi:complement C1q tumor necrosis factor-related protein 5-like [Dreissena polymorpha]|uniref:C1q domain-containing protein n=1 Tax=Dreissena polymorpha TaxID=45954 RepID=A0A9D3Y7L6_DREPO|nr:complement C1q tumor necrosis factor-related protein 5-like [Dreissena polymorpha]KAH3693312.1 hypothetical protein DPMN_192716 [Dreissena polymorpha]
MWSVLASCVTVVMFGTSLAVEPSCPVCSKYEYEVKLLERVLSNEMALANTLNKITETRAKVEDSLKSIQAENVKLNNAMLSLEVMKGPLVMFHARHLDGQYTYAANQDVVFKTVLANEGGGYDPNTGHFKASVAGVYMFTVQYCPFTKKYGCFGIVHDGKPLQRSFHYETDSAVCVSMQAFAKVAKGDRVWVRGSYVTSEIYSYEGERWSGFAGLLIRVL